MELPNRTNHTYVVWTTAFLPPIKNNQLRLAIFQNIHHILREGSTAGFVKYLSRLVSCSPLSRTCLLRWLWCMYFVNMVPVSTSRVPYLSR